MRFIFFITIFFIVSCDNFDRDDFSFNSDQPDDFEDVDTHSNPDLTEEQDNFVANDDTVIVDDSFVTDSADEVPDTQVTPDVNETPDESGHDVYEVVSTLCKWCGRCAIRCTTGAISNIGGKAVIDPLKCSGCGDCVSACPRGAIRKKE